MKLKKLLKNIDEWTYLIIWDQIGITEEKWDIAYEGYASEVPWDLADKHLIKPEDNNNSSAIAAFHTEDDAYGIRITLADE